MVPMTCCRHLRCLRCLRWKRYSLDQYRHYHHLFERTLHQLRSNRLLPEDAVIHASASGPVYSGIGALYYDMVRIGTLIYHGSRPERHYRLRVIQVKRLARGPGYQGEEFGLSSDWMDAVLIEDFHAFNNSEFTFHGTPLPKVMHGILDASRLSVPIGVDDVVDARAVI